MHTSDGLLTSWVCLLGLILFTGFVFYVVYWLKQQALTQVTDMKGNEKAVRFWK